MRIPASDRVAGGASLVMIVGGRVFPTWLGDVSIGPTVSDGRLAPSQQLRLDLAGVIRDVTLQRDAECALAHIAVAKDDQLYLRELWDRAQRAFLDHHGNPSDGPQPSGNYTTNLEESHD
jgi:hypothetical protein